MIREITGDLTRVRADIICHQVNFYGVMGGGVAAAIWDKLLDDPGRRAYQDHCIQNGRGLLGTIQIIPFVRKSDGHMYAVANLFCQLGRPKADGSLTSYGDMCTCLAMVEHVARENGGLTVALPYNMGCGIAGGDWVRVRRIIENIFADSPIDCTIVRWDKDGVSR